MTLNQTTYMPKKNTRTGGGEFVRPLLFHEHPTEQKKREEIPSESRKEKKGCGEGTKENLSRTL